VSVLALDREALNRAGLTATDVSVLTALSYRLSAEGIAGACVPAMMDDGQRLVAILNPDNDAIVFGFGKDEHGYFVFDWEGRALIEACLSIDEILAVFK
jgi:hypothetical protein